MKRRSKGPYTVRLGGGGCRSEHRVDFSTIRDARAWADSYGSSADWFSIHDHQDVEIAAYRRDTSGRGDRWFRAAI